MKWVLLILLGITILLFIWAGQIYITGRVADEKLGALMPLAAGCVSGLVFLVLLIVRSIFS